MAHETLKSLIRQYINTNGQEAITGQILQDVLIEMVNEYPIVDTYLPLAGGTMTGEIKSGDLLTGSYSLSNTGIGFSYSYTGNTRYEQRIFISSVNQVISFTTRGGQAQGTLINVSSVTSGSFIKLGGTASEFLKADGSVDNNNYLPLTGGTMNGNLNFTLGNVVSIPISEGTRRGNTLNIGLFDVEGTNYAWVYRSWPSNTVLAGLDISGYMVSTGYKTPNGTSDQFLKADGSVDNNTYLTTAILNNYATQTWVGQNYLALTGGTMRNNNGNTNTILPNKIEIMYSDTDLDVDKSLELLPGELRFVESDEEYINLYKNSTQLRFALEEGGFANLYAGSFVKSGGTSLQFLKADGSVDDNSYVPMTSINWGTILFDSASNGTYLRAIGDTFSMAITEGRWAPFSSDPSVLQVSGGRTAGSTITYTVAQTVAAKVLIFLVNLDNPQQIIIDNVEIRPL